jgi:DNA-binding helix-hairpin-helix protein with protein kinase domain
VGLKNPDPSSAWTESFAPFDDVFALGVTAYQLAIARHPFSGSELRRDDSKRRAAQFAIADATSGRRRRRGYRLAKVRPTLARDVADTIDACLSIDERDRPALSAFVNESLQ